MHGNATVYSKLSLALVCCLSEIVCELLGPFPVIIRKSYSTEFAQLCNLPGRGGLCLCDFISKTYIPFFAVGQACGSLLPRPTSYQPSLPYLLECALTPQTSSSREVGVLRFIRARNCIELQPVPFLPFLYLRSTAHCRH